MEMSFGGCFVTRKYAGCQVESAGGEGEVAAIGGGSVQGIVGGVRQME